MPELRCCPRCARPCPSTARYCATCGLDLAAANNVELAPRAPTGMSTPVSAWSSVSGHRRARLVLVGLVLCLLLDLVGVFSDVAERELLLIFQRVSTITASLEHKVQANDSRQALIGLAQLLAFLTTAIVFLRWWHRAYRNLTWLGASKPRYTPGWAVGYWFVPFLNLLRPYQIAKELWIGSAPRAAAIQQPPSPSTAVVAAWWAVWILNGFVGQLLLRAALKTELADPTLADLLRTNATNIVGDVGGVISAALAICVVRGIDIRQETAGVGTHDG